MKVATVIGRRLPASLSCPRWLGSFPAAKRMRGAGAHKFFSDREKTGVRGLGCAFGVRGCAGERDGRY